MKCKTLLLIVFSITIVTHLNAQRAEKKVTGYAITAPQKGQTGWREVRLVNIATGEELQSIYKATDELEPLNARTGKPIVKKDKQVVEQPMQAKRRTVNLDQVLSTTSQPSNVRVYMQDADRKMKELKLDEKELELKLKELKIDKSIHQDVNINTNVNTNTNVNITRSVIVVRGEHTGFRHMPYDKPFATNSAAMAYDKKHERLYYTPMNINQLRYIDLKDKSPKVYYFEDEPFGAVSGMGDVNNQITRMVIASDGNGYALSNDGNHLIKFTTGKKPTITDLGSLTDETSNAAFSVHSRNGYGGDMIADDKENLYLITANRNVFKINIETKVAKYLGAIKGLPKGFSTNGAMVDEGTKVIVASSESTVGYFRFDVNTLIAEKVSGEGSVFNASDLANGNLLKTKKDKKNDEPKPTVPVVPEEEKIARGNQPEELQANNGIAIFPNPVTTGMVKVSFKDQPAGKYNMELLDISGRLIKAKQVNINSTMQIEEFRTPELNVKGNYLLKVSNVEGKVSVTNKVVVQ